jgi:hypothetical protein
VIVLPGLAASTAAWIDSPGRTTCPWGFAEAKPANAVPPVIAAITNASISAKMMRLITHLLSY